MKKRRFHCLPLLKALALPFLVSHPEMITFSPADGGGIVAFAGAIARRAP